MDLLFFLNSILFGIGLAMDAFSVSLVNGLAEPKMKKRKMCGIAGTFAFFQIVMPLIGWVCVHTVATMFEAFTVAIPYIALALLLFIGGKMLIEGIRNQGGDERPAVSFGALLLQGVATSIDALSVGFTIAGDPFASALVESLIIGAVTFGICVMGVMLGRVFGTRMQNRASILGGVILIAIGIEIFVTGVFF